MRKAPNTYQASGASGKQLSFLPPPPFCPQYPTKGTLPDKALAMFLEGEVFDHPEFEGRTRSWRLSDVVFRLKDLGWPIETIEIPSPTNDCPDRIIALYRLSDEHRALALAGKRGDYGRQ